MTADPIVLKEFITQKIPAAKIPKELGFRLWQEFGTKISINEPSFKNDEQWEITSQGWVGYIPFSEELSFYLQPKVPLQNLFGMWEYAYRLKSFEFFPGLFQSESLQQFYEQLANILAKRILDRGRKGYYRAYISRSEELSFLRGKLNINQLITNPWNPHPHCDFQENTADVEENQILAWTLFVILRSGICSEHVLPTIRNCYRNIGHIVSLQPFNPKDCLGRLYNRLNQDYMPLHSLCRFFLENIGPSYEIGDHTMLPFLVDMASLFELFVAEWLQINLPPDYELKKQERIKIDNKGDVFFKIDIVIYNANTKEPICVLDTKYKDVTQPSADDIAQIGFNALAKNCYDAILVYPSQINHPLNEIVNHINIRSSTFSLDGDLETAGRTFLKSILKLTDHQN